MHKNVLDIEYITHDNAQEIYKNGQSSLLEHKNLHIDFNSLKKFDSSIFAVILGWRRIASQNQLVLNIILSEKLQTLADVYGISDIL